MKKQEIFWSEKGVEAIYEFVDDDGNLKRTGTWMSASAEGRPKVFRGPKYTMQNELLVVCCEITAIAFRGPNPDDPQIDYLVSQALFGDGAAAVIVGSDPDLSNEKPLFEIVSSSQTFIPNSEGAIGGRLSEAGLIFHLGKTVPELISKNIENILTHVFSPSSITDWNSIFWIVHPGGPAILDQMEVKLGLKKEKMRASRHVLSEYGNMSHVSVLFVIDEMGNRSGTDGSATTGEGLDWGVLIGFGPGLTFETLVLHSFPTSMLISIATQI